MANSKKYPRSEAIQNAEYKGEPMYLSWDGAGKDERAAAFGALNDAVEEFSGHSSAHIWGGGHGQRTLDYSDLDTNVSGRPGLTREDYGRFRPSEALPVRRREIIAAAENIYQRVGLIRNIIDLMGDFACQGVRIVHPNKRIERFYRNWFNRIGGKDRSERFLNNLYRTGSVIVRRLNAKVKVATQEDLFRSIANPEIEIEKLRVNKKEIPWKYVYLDPTMVDVVGGPLAAFVGQQQYAIRLPDSLSRMIKSPKNTEERALVSQLPKEIIDAASASRPVLLPQESTRVFHYKKDDWRAWANPMIYAIMQDIILLEKLKLADLAALDGAISQIRIFKLGSLEHKLAPTRAAAARLSAILENHTGVGTFDIVWGPDIELLESKTNVHQFLGADKYDPTLQNIYSGLGIPPTLTGTFGGGTTNNFVSLKTLIQRLEYGRNVLTQFWNEELVRVQKAMGFRFPAKVEFEMANLGDSDSEKSLLIQLADRNLISDELVQMRFGNDPDLERIRLNREQKDREAGRMVPKSGPWYDPQFEISLKKTALQTQVVTPSQVGLDLPKAKKGEKPGLMMRQPAGPGGGGVKGKPPTKKSGQPQQGRPKNTKDSTKRKTKTFTPKNKAVLEIWAGAARTAIGEVVNAGILEQFGKSNLRSLTANEMKQAEEIKFGVLCGLEPCGEVSPETIHAALKNNSSVPEDIRATYLEWSAQISTDLERSLTIDELRKVQTCAYIAHVGCEEED